MDFITAYITKEFIFTGKPQRDERWQYPLEAIREIAVKNWPDYWDYPRAV